jgi:hypothetical protein
VENVQDYQENWKKTHSKNTGNRLPKLAMYDKPTGKRRELMETAL